MRLASNQGPRALLSWCAVLDHHISEFGPASSSWDIDWTQPVRERKPKKNAQRRVTDPKIIAWKAVRRLAVWSCVMGCGCGGPMIVPLCTLQPLRRHLFRLARVSLSLVYAQSLFQMMSGPARHWNTYWLYSIIERVMGRKPCATAPL